MKQTCAAHEYSDDEGIEYAAAEHTNPTNSGGRFATNNVGGDDISLYGT